MLKKRIAEIVWEAKMNPITTGQVDQLLELFEEEMKDQ